MASPAAVKQLVDAIAGAISTPIEELIENPLWGEINFKNIELELRISTDLLRRVHDFEIEKLPENIVSGIVGPATQLSNAVKRITDFSITQGDTNKIRQQISNGVISASNTLLTNFGTLLPILDFIEGKSDSGNIKFEHLIAETEEHSAKFLDDLLVTAKEAETALAATKEAAGKTGVGVFTQDFAAEAKKYGSAAKSWLWTTVLLGIATLVVAVFYSKAFYIPDTEKWLPIIQYTTTKIVVIGLLITATLWCGRLYKTARHHETINKHRANALATFQAFVEATNEPSVKDAVLLETTRSIFSITPTGYVGGDSGRADNNTIIEVIKGVTTKGEK
jgi:hypothetical protein